MDGKFIRKIGNIGKGPGEYEYAGSFSIDRLKNHIYINDLHKMIIYNLQGKLIDEYKIKAENTFNSFLFKKNLIYELYYISNNLDWKQMNMWRITTPKGDKLFEKPNLTTGFKKIKYLSMLGLNYYTFNNNVYYWNHYNDTIFELDELTYKPKYLFKRDSYRLTPEASSEWNIVQGKTKIYIPSLILESNKYLILRYKQNKNNHICIYDKLSKKFVSRSIGKEWAIGIENDIDGGLSFIPKYYHVINGREYLSCYITPSDLLEHLNSDKFKSINIKNIDKKETLIKLANSLDENDNPVIMLIKLKQ